MPDELFTQDLLALSANAETREVIGAYTSASANGATPTLAMFDGSMMKRFGRSLAMLERADENAMRVLYAGKDTPDDNGRPISGRPVAELAAGTRSLFENGAKTALGLDAPALILHRAPLGAPVHRWEVLFLPLAEVPDGPRTLVAAFAAPVEHKHSFFRALLDNLPHATLVIEPKGPGAPMAIADIIAANEGAVRLLGHGSLEELLARPLAEAFHEHDVENGWMRLVAEMHPGTSARFEYNHRCGNSAHWFDVQVSPLGDGLMISLSDISDLKRTILDLDHQRKALIEEMEQRRTLEEELWALAHLDPLTGLPNRRAFRDDAQTTLIAAQTLHRHCAMISIDIDHFKRVNDTFGHGAGDIVLRRVADILRAPLRPEVDFAARMGGEEFAVLLPDTDMAGARAFAEMLRHRVEHTVVISGDAEIRPTISLGVAMVSEAGDLDNLLDRSDRALYAAKRAGRNRVMAEGEAVEDAQAA